MAKQIKPDETGVDPQDYYVQMKRNEETFKRLARNIRPEWYVLIDLLEVTGINPLILLKVMRQLVNLASGTGYGTVTISMENKVATFVRGEESDKLGVEVLTPPNNPLA